MSNSTCRLGVEAFDRLQVGGPATAPDIFANTSMVFAHASFDALGIFGPARGRGAVPASS